VLKSRQDWHFFGIPASPSFPIVESEAYRALCLQSAPTNMALAGDVQLVPGLGLWSDPLPIPVLSSFTLRQLFLTSLGAGFRPNPFVKE
jgi:hypothetical protein